MNEIKTVSSSSSTAIRVSLSVSQVLIQQELCSGIHVYVRVLDKASSVDDSLATHRDLIRPNIVRLMKFCNKVLKR